MTATPTLETLSSSAERLAQRRREMVEAATAMEIEVADVRKRHMPALRKIAIDVKAIASGLQDMVSRAGALFTKPKSRTVADIQFGFKKGRGSMEFDDEAKVISRIRKHLPHLADTAIVTKETVAKDVLNKLSGAELKLLGVSIVDPGDAPFVKAKDADTDELIALALGKAS